MPAKLGTADASFRLGSATPSKVYLGNVEVWTAARTLYFLNATADGNWNTLANWYDDAVGEFAASSLPTSADSVIAKGTITSNSGSAPTVVDFTLDDISDGLSLSIFITVTGMATFNGASVNSGTVTGNATFNDSTIHAGTVSGSAVFNDDSNNYGLVSGTATFNDQACNDGGTAGVFVPNPPPSC